jgi:hypothetical protein
MAGQRKHDLGAGTEASGRIHTAAENWLEQAAGAGLHAHIEAAHFEWAQPLEDAALVVCSDLGVAAANPWVVSTSSVGSAGSHDSIRRVRSNRVAPATPFFAAEENGVAGQIVQVLAQ